MRLSKQAAINLVEIFLSQYFKINWKFWDCDKHYRKGIKDIQDIDFVLHTSVETGLLELNIKSYGE
ncbi:MAG: hypothetical protein WC523_04350 [Patescibacteria group bacterium]